MGWAYSMSVRDKNIQTFNNTKEEKPSLKQADDIKRDLIEIGCENVVCSTDFEVESIVRILRKI
jgi:hypothetical protein